MLCRVERVLLSIVCDGQSLYVRRDSVIMNLLKRDFRTSLSHRSACSRSRAVKEIDVEFFLRWGGMLKHLQESKMRDFESSTRVAYRCSLCQLIQYRNELPSSSKGFHCCCTFQFRVESVLF